MADDDDRDPLGIGSFSSTFSGISCAQGQSMLQRNNRVYDQILRAAQESSSPMGAHDVKPGASDVTMTGVG
jgi:hypothetical protein